jgi:hypothetical protein
MTPQHFIAKWGPGGPAAYLNEEQGAQSHFLDLCELLDVPKPGSGDTADYVFEQRSLHLGEARGYADVFYRDHFAWENKAPGKNLDAALRAHAVAIAEAAHRLDTLRQNWLNPPEWTVRVPEVVPPGMDHSPYPDRIEPRPGLAEADAKALQQCTLTRLYNQRPAWLAQAHAALDAAYGWADYTPEMPDDEILRRLLALNRERA